MVAKTLTMSCFVAVSIASGTALADLRKAPAAEAAAPHVVKYTEPANGINAPVVFFTNLTNDPLRLYETLVGGYYVAGSANTLATPPDPAVERQQLAIQFQPKVSGNAKTLQAAIGYISGTERVRLGLYTDNAGTVGTLLGQVNIVNIPDYTICCQLAQGNLPGTGVALTAGTKYWLAAYSDEVNAASFGGVWQPVVSDIAANIGQPPTGWATFPGNSLVPAGAVRGTSP
jgi:hypothetical protein